MIASQLNNYFLLFGNAISNVMTPRVHRLVAENAPHADAGRPVHQGGRIQFILLGGIFPGQAIGQSFVVLWGGGEQFPHRLLDGAAAVLCLPVDEYPDGGHRDPAHKNMHKVPLPLVYLGVLVGNIIISIPLCMKWEASARPSAPPSPR